MICKGDAMMCMLSNQNAWKQIILFHIAVRPFGKKKEEIIWMRENMWNPTTQKYLMTIFTQHANEV